MLFLTQATKQKIIQDWIRRFLFCEITVAVVVVAVFADEIVNIYV